MSVRAFFFNDTATTEIYTLSLHDALPIYGVPLIIPPLYHEIITATITVEREAGALFRAQRQLEQALQTVEASHAPDRKSTRLNSSHANISYAVFCLKKKKTSYTHSIWPLF